MRHDDFNCFLTKIRAFRTREEIRRLQRLSHASPEALILLIFAQKAVEAIVSRCCKLRPRYTTINDKCHCNTCAHLADDGHEVLWRKRFFEIDGKEEGERAGQDDAPQLAVDVGIAKDFLY